MNVTRLRLANFKRFTDLTIDLTSCAGTPKLVLLIGANGSGKSSVFDAFEYLSGQHKGAPQGLDLLGFALRKDGGTAYARYLKKDLDAETSVSCSFGGGFEINRSNESQAAVSPPKWDVQSAFYGRSSLPDHSRSCAAYAATARGSAPTAIARAATSIRTGGSRPTSRK